MKTTPMAKLYRLLYFRPSGVLTFILSLSAFALHAQEMLQGVVRMKVNESLASTLEQRTLSRTAHGDILTGVQTIDQLNRQFHVRKFTRVFPHAGKNEARHRKYGLHLWYEMRLDKSMPMSHVLQSYQSDKRILKVEPVYKKAIIGSGSPFYGPRVLAKDAGAKGMLPGPSNDPLLTSQWHYHNTGQTGGTPNADISLFDAWKVQTGTPDVVIAVTDGGVDVDHPDLAANLWVNKDEVPDNNLDDDNNGYVDDLYGYSFVHDSGSILPDSHGTHVAGTVGAVTNNSEGVAGVAGGSGNGDGVRIMSCAVFHADSLSDGFAEAYVYSADNGAVISQNSWGYTLPGVYEQVVLDAIDYFIAEAGKNEKGQQTGPMNGGLAIFSAGNYDTEGDYYPAAYEPVLAVASSTHKDKRAQYSNYGTWVDITAPGGETYDNSEQGVVSTLPFGSYGWYMGTSMACPHVSGVAGLVVSEFGRQGLTPLTVKQRLVKSVDNIYRLNPGFEGKLGSGRLNAMLALRQGDQRPPEPIADLRVASKDVGQITLTWTSPNDASGFITAYDLRYSKTPITEANFNSAIAVSGLAEPQPSGSRETFTVKNLPGGVEYFFAIRSIDFEGNVSSLSNVVSETSARTPVISVSPSSLTKTLKTAQVATESVTISNTGEGELTFNISLSEAPRPFASVQSTAGAVPAGQTKTIPVKLDASGLLAGTYRQKLTITSNDPVKPSVVVPLNLTVQNNGVPIAGITPQTIDFKSVQVGNAASRKVTISNAGSEPLIINKISSNNTAFRATAKMPLTIEAFENVEVEITFTPSRTGKASGEVILQGNDPSTPNLSVTVSGEGLNEAPLTVSPGSFDETLERGTSLTRQMVLSNNGSQDRKFRIEIANSRLESGMSTTSSRKTVSQTAPSKDSLSARVARMLQKHRSALSGKEEAQLNLVKSFGSGSRQGSNAHARKTRSEATEVRQYKTGFEEFSPGPVGEQHGWFASHGWEVSNDNAKSGSQHLRGNSEGADGSERYALSPYLFEADEYLYPRYTSASMRINADGAKGTSWEIVPQDPWSYIATRIRFNADGTIDAFVIDNDYEFHWKRVPVAAPKGYFDLAIEYNNWGSDTSGFPTYYLFINNHHVFSGTGLGSAIGQVAFVTQTETAGPVFDVDDFNLSGGEYIPHFITASPAEGTVRAGQSLNVSVEFDATVMKYGSYQSDILVHLDHTDTLVVPAALTVTGEPSLLTDLWGIHMQLQEGDEGWQQMTITNTGGREISYNFETEMEGLTVSPQKGMLAVRENELITITFSNTPGLYNGELILHNDAGEPVVFPVTITVYANDAKFSAPQIVHYDVQAGEVSMRSLWVKNAGTDPVSFYITPSVNSEGLLTVEPLSTTFEDSVEVMLSIDGTRLGAGPKTWWLDFTTNDPNNEQAYVQIELNVLADTITSAKISRELWTNIPGKEVSLIPLQTSPQSTSFLKVFESSPNQGDNYGSRVRGYVQAPVSGYYTFYISSDDQSELWLSEDDSEDHKKKIAWVTGSTRVREWSKFPSQTSQQIYLEENRKYYIEALHKENTGGDHLSVGWHEESIGFERPIPGLRLIPYKVAVKNQSPVVHILSPAEGESFVAPAHIEVKADATDSDGTIVKVEFFVGDERLGIDVNSPYSFNWNEVEEGKYELTVKATDNLGAVDSAVMHISVGDGAPCREAGAITREHWNNVRGSDVSDIPLATDPSTVSTLSIFESPADIGDHYGARIRGYLCVPQSGEYTFWIASNDKSELWLSGDANPENKSRIAHVSKATQKRQWNKRSSQKSRRIYLEQGTLYYIEALHKEGSGNDHLSVGWQLPDGTMERPILGTRLIAFEAYQGPLSIALTSPARDEKFPAPATIDISASASSDDADIARVVFYSNDRPLGEDQSSPYQFRWNDVPGGTYVITAVVTDTRGRSARSAPVEINVEGTCTATGTIIREYWTGIPGNSVSRIPVHTTPDGHQELTMFKAPVNAGSNYGARIRGFVCAPQTGEYFFWITSNDQSELWLSTDDDPNNKKRIAMVRAGTDVDEWDELPFQRSRGIMLRKGQTYYIEALHKHSKGTDHIAVGWQLPDGTMERPIAGSHLSPFTGATAMLPGEGGQPEVDTLSHQTIAVQAYPNPIQGGALNIEIQHGDSHQSDVHEIVIRQLTGLAVYSQKVNCSDGCNREVDVTRDLSPGVYILQVRVGERVFTEKLLVE